MARSLNLSLREFDGWTATEKHKHYDADGNLTGVTEVTRSSPWDDQARAEMEALYLYEGLHCSGCGQHYEDAGDPTKPWDVDTHICWACRALAINQRRFGDKHADDGPDAAGAMPDDGLSWAIKPWKPNDPKE